MFCKFQDIDYTKTFIIPKYLFKTLRTLLYVHQFRTLIRNNVATKITLGFLLSFSWKVAQINTMYSKIKNKIFL